SSSDAVVSLTHAALAEMNKRLPSLEITKKTSIIPCCTNTTLFDPEKTEERKIADISGNDHLIIYTGSVGTWYYTREMIDCVLCWRELIPEIKLLIVTKDREELEKTLSRYNKEELRTIVSASASYKEIPSYL